MLSISPITLSVNDNDFAVNISSYPPCEGLEMHFLNKTFSKALENGTANTSRDSCQNGGTYELGVVAINAVNYLIY